MASSAAPMALSAKLIASLTMRHIYALAIALLAAVAASDAHAHATLLQSDPADGSVLEAAPAQFVLTFNEPVSPIAVRLIASDGSGSDLADVTARDTTVSAPLPPLAKGTHALSWRVISADGHPVGGSVVFSIGALSSMQLATPTTDPIRSPAIWFARLALYLGLFIGVGGAFFAAWIADGPLPASAGHFVGAVIVVGLVAVPVSLSLQGLDVRDASFGEAVGWRTLAAALGTSYALTLAIATVALLLALTRQRIPAAVALALVGAALAASGHASDAAVAARVAIFVHGISVAFWIGALVPLAATLGTASLSRFSRIAPLPVALLIASGIVMAVVQLGSPSAIPATPYGRIFAAKMVLVVLLLAVAAWNRWRLTPRHDDRALRRSIVVEVALVAVILGLVAGWRFTPPPRALAEAAAAAAPLHVHIHGEKAMADVSVTPGKVGPVSVSLAIQSGDFGPLDAKAVKLTLTNSAAGIEPIRREATHLDGVLWRVDGLILPAPGTWTARVDVLIGEFEQVTLEQPIVVPP